MNFDLVFGGIVLNRVYNQVNATDFAEDKRFAHLDHIGFSRIPGVFSIYFTEIVGNIVRVDIAGEVAFAGHDAGIEIDDFRFDAVYLKNRAAGRIYHYHCGVSGQSRSIFV